MPTVFGALLRHVETRTLLILIAVTGGVWAFIELADAERPPMLRIPEYRRKHGITDD